MAFTQSDESRHDFAFIAGAIIGAIAGALVTLALTPMSGADTRQKLRSRAEELGPMRDRAMEAAAPVREKALGVAAPVKEKALHAAEPMKEKVGAMATTAAEKGKTIAAPVREKATDLAAKTPLGRTSNSGDIDAMLSESELAAMAESGNDAIESSNGRISEEPSSS